MKKIIFSYNWNFKLSGKSFTTIRLNGSYVVGDLVQVFLKKNILGVYEITAKKIIKLNDINEWISRIDTGYSAEQCKDILKKMYSKEGKIDWETQPIYFYLLSKHTFKIEQIDLFDEEK